MLWHNRTGQLRFDLDRKIKERFGGKFKKMFTQCNFSSG